MKQRNWVLFGLGAIGLMWFVLSRTVWGPPSRAAAADEAPVANIAQEHDSEDMSDAQRRYISNQPHHWRYVMLKRN